MNKTTMISTIAASMAALALASTPAVAGQGKGKGKGHDAHHAHHPSAAKGHAPKAAGRHDNGLHLGWHKQAWKRGDRLPLADIGPGYYVEDYRAYRLAPPPAGYRWVRPMDDRYLLVEVATGVIRDVLGY